MTRRGNYTFERGPSQLKIERILALISRKPLTEPEISERLHISRDSMRQYIKHLHENHMIHIDSWNRAPVCGQRPFPRAMYKAGQGENKPKPKRRTKRENDRDYRRRVMANPDEYEIGYRKIRADRARQELRRKNQRLQTLAAAGFNPHTMAMISGRVLLGEKRRSPTPDQVAEIIRLRESGMYWDDIAKATGVPKSTARDHYQRVMG